MATILQNAQKISAAIDDAYAALADRLADIPAEKTATNLSAAVESITMTTDELLEINGPARDFVFKGDVVPETFFSGTNVTAYITLNTPTDGGGGNLFWKRGHVKTVKFNPDCDVQRAGCYQMFRDQTSLTDVKSLPAGVIGPGAFSGMFAGCTNLTSVADLSVQTTNTSTGLYNAMLSGCTSLRTPPALPNFASVPQQAFRYMFAGCTSLTAAPTMPTSTPTVNAYYGMFEGCTSLQTPSDLPAENIAEAAAYRSMFEGCTALTSIPSMPAINIGQATGVCQNMFKDCTSLTGEVTVRFKSNNNQVGSNNFISMFANCSNLTKVIFDFSALGSVITLANANAIAVFGSSATVGDSRFEIRVPAALEASWKTASNWSTYATRIVGV